MSENDLLFTDSHAAAQSQRNRWTRLASTWRSIRITLTPETLVVMPQPLVKWLTVLLGLDLCHEVAVGDILAVRSLGEESGYGKIEIAFRAPEGGEKRLLLWLENGRSFIDAVQDVIKEPHAQRQ